ncbi:hypothetical protein DENSPDRAFT_848982 [Dentipellis sp. KUC8613]|nr:hypothetical protein DENSPDRAFT_848982 [Dentipellis sp. KUC8613]
MNILQSIAYNDGKLASNPDKRAEQCMSWRPLGIILDSNVKMLQFVIPELTDNAFRVANRLSKRFSCSASRPSGDGNGVALPLSTPEAAGSHPLSGNFSSLVELGKDWKHIPSYEDRARCGVCNADDESLEHILVLCPAETKELVWKLARDLWPYDDTLWPDTSFGTLLACGSLEVGGPTHGPEPETLPDSLRPSASTLLRILISESMHLIWVLRCEREIGERQHSVQEIIARWSRNINDRLLTDRIIATKIKRHDADMLYLRDTWEKVLIDPPDDWHTNLEVLVGIKPPSPLL